MFLSFSFLFYICMSVVMFVCFFFVYLSAYLASLLCLFVNELYICAGTKISSFKIVVIIANQLTIPFFN